MRRISNRKSKKRTRVANKPRFTLFCAICVLILTMSVGTLTSAQATRSEQSYMLCVSTGDTLWDIARSSNTKGKDLRRVVDDIMKLNNMRSTNIKSGDMLRIPIY